MKKLLLATTLAGAVLLTTTACGKEEEEPKQENKQLSETQKDLDKTKEELKEIKDNQNNQNNQEAQAQDSTNDNNSNNGTSQQNNSNSNSNSNQNSNGTNQDGNQQPTGGTDAGFDLSEEEYNANITREDVFDQIELVEGGMDTDLYEYNEPEKKSDGSWGLAFYDKDTGDLAGSYIVAKDGEPFKYDENGDLIW